MSVASRLFPGRGGRRIGTAAPEISCEIYRPKYRQISREVSLRAGGEGAPLLLHGCPRAHVCWHKIASAPAGSVWQPWRRWSTRASAAASEAHRYLAKENPQGPLAAPIPLLAILAQPRMTPALTPARAIRPSADRWGRPSCA
jgi:hypothetical protein